MPPLCIRSSSMAGTAPTLNFRPVARLRTVQSSVEISARSPYEKASLMPGHSSASRNQFADAPANAEIAQGARGGPARSEPEAFACDNNVAFLHEIDPARPIRLE